MQAVNRVSEGDSPYIWHDKLEMALLLLQYKNIEQVLTLEENRLSDTGRVLFCFD